MGAPLEGRELMTGVEEFENHLLQSGILKLGDDRPRVNLPSLVATRRDERESEVDTQGELAQRADALKLEASSRSDLALIKLQAEDARPATILLKAHREKAEITAPDPVEAAGRGRALRRSRYVAAAVAIIGLAGLGAGAVFWRDASSLSDVSQVAAGVGPFQPPSQSDESVETAAKDASTIGPAPTIDSSPLRPDAPPPQEEAAMAPPAASEPAPPVDSPPPGPDAPRPQAEAAMVPPAPSLSELTNPTPIALAAPQTQSVPLSAGVLAPPEPNKAEAEPPARIESAPSSADAAPQFVAAPSPPPAVVAPASAPRAATVTLKKPKPTVAAKPKSRHTSEKVASRGRTDFPEGAARPEPAEPVAAAQTEAPAQKPSAPPDSGGPLAYLKRAQQAVGSVAGTVKNWIGVDVSHP